MIQFLIAESCESPKKIQFLNQNWGRSATASSRRSAPFRDSKKGVSFNPQGPASSLDPNEPHMPKRVIRGGSYLCNDSYCSGYRVSKRMRSSQDTGLSHTGFRCVKSI